MELLALEPEYTLFMDVSKEFIWGKRQPQLA